MIWFADSQQIDYVWGGLQQPFPPVWHWSSIADFIQFQRKQTATSDIMIVLPSTGNCTVANRSTNWSWNWSWNSTDIANPFPKEDVSDFPIEDVDVQSPFFYANRVVSKAQLRSARLFANTPNVCWLMGSTGNVAMWNDARYQGITILQIACTNNSRPVKEEITIVELYMFDDDTARLMLKAVYADGYGE